MTDVVKRARELLQNKWGEGWPIIGRKTFAKIPFYGEVVEETRLVKGVEKPYFPIVRQSGWAVVFGVSFDERDVLTLIQWKPGVNRGSWELPPGGIGSFMEDAPIKTILERTKEIYRKETGYGDGEWIHLDHIAIETGMYRGATVDSHGFRAHLFLADGLRRISGTEHQQNEMIELFPVPLQEFRQVLESGLFVEESAVVCAYKALVKLGFLTWEI